ncbi:MAG: glycosyltransferase [Bacteroidales bacterium]|nr:glycosyltransferase [Bacteroidales bacterium]
MFKTFLNKYYKTWSIPWILQRFILVIKQGRLSGISWRNLLIDYRFTRKVSQKLDKESGYIKNIAGRPFDLSSLFNLTGKFEFPTIITSEGIAPEKLSAVNSYFDKVYVINLEKRADRRLEMIQKLTKLGIKAEFFAAQDGSDEENLNEYKAYQSKPIDPETAHELEIQLKRKVIYSSGAWSTLKTYRNLIQNAIDRNFERILCFEDDVIFADNFENLFLQATLLIPQSWKLLYLGASQHAWQEGIDLFYPSPEPDDRQSGSFYYPLNTDGAFAIGIHRSVFSFLLSEIDKMNCSFDSGPLRRASKFFRGECYVLHPNLIIADVRDSDISLPKKQSNFAKTVRWNLENYCFPFEKDLVSVIIPAYNASSTIEKSIASLLLQTYKELEIIVVDDCSSDNTCDIIEKSALRDKRIKLIRHENNSGCYIARNTGVRASKGKYIAFQDADDFSFPNRIESQIIPLCLDKAEFTMSRIVRSQRKPEEFNIESPGQMINLILQSPGENQSSATNGDVFQNIGHISAVFKRSLFQELGLFWENSFGSDAEYIERILFQKAGIKLPPTVFVQRYLAEVGHIDGLFKLVDKVLMICLIEGNSNLSVKFNQDKRIAFQNRYRENFEKAKTYQYPGL